MNLYVLEELVSVGSICSKQLLDNIFGAEFCNFSNSKVIADFTENLQV